MLERRLLVQKTTYSSLVAEVTTILAGVVLARYRGVHRYSIFESDSQQLIDTLVKKEVVPWEIQAMVYEL